MDINLTLLSDKPVRREMFNFKSSEGQQTFSQLTLNTKDFTMCFKNDLPVLQQVEIWRNVLKTYFRKSFKKIRIRRNMKMKPINPLMSKLINQRNALLNKPEELQGVPDKRQHVQIVEELNLRISEFEAEDNRN